MRLRLHQNVLALFSAFMILTGTGCGIVVVAGLGALGGYVISPDAVEGIVGYSESELFSSAVDVVSIMGTITEQSKGIGHITANLSGVKVTVDVLPQSKSSTKLRVKARKWIFPKMAIAQDVYMKTIRRLQE